MSVEYPSENSEREQLNRFIRLLQLYSQRAVTLRTSPIPLLLETLIDLFLEMKLLLKEPTRAPRENLELIFLDNDIQDELGNSKQVRRPVKKFKPSIRDWYDPSAFLFIDKLVSSLIRIKSGTPIPVAIMALADEVLELKTVPVLQQEEVDPQIKDLSPREAEIRKNANQTWYLKRKEQERRKRRSRKRSKLN